MKRLKQFSLESVFITLCLVFLSVSAIEAHAGNPGIPVTTLNSSTVAENTAIGSDVATLSNGGPDTYTYTLVTGTGSTHNFYFSITGDKLKIANEINYESKTSLNIRVRTTDDADASFTEKQFSITVTNVNENPTELALSSNTIEENQPVDSVIGTFSSQDPDAGNTFTYDLVNNPGYPDNGAFTVIGDSLQTNSSFDFESKSTYDVLIRTTDGGGLSYISPFCINVIDVNEAPSNIAIDNSSVLENQIIGTLVGSLSTTDQDAANTFTYSLVSGIGDTDNASFDIVDNKVNTNEIFNFEVKDSYTIRVKTVDQGGLFNEKSFTISIDNVNETPTDISLSGTHSIAENQTDAAIGTLSTTDPDDLTNAGNYTYTLESGDTTNFSIDNTGVLSNVGSFDYETKSSYTVKIRTTDSGGLYYEKDFTIEVVDVNETPTELTLDNNTIDENLDAGSTVGGLSTTDQDAANTFTYTLVTGVGDTDNASFEIAGNKLNTIASLNFEAKSSYSVRIRTTDQDGLYYEEDFAVTVVDLNEAPSNISLDNSSVAENEIIDTAVGSFTTTDEDAANTFTYSLVAGVGSSDNESFTLSTDGALKTAVAFDKETKNSYSIRVKSTDQGGLYYEKEFTITVTNVNEVPTELALSTATIDENNSIDSEVGSFTTTDQDVNDTFTYTLVTGTGDDDNASFDIVNNKLNTKAVFNYEVKNSYTVRVRTTDADNLHYEKAFTISIANVNETPTALALSGSHSLAENQSSGTVVGSLSTTDPDAANTFTYSLVAGSGDTDNASFSILTNSLKTAAVFNFEVKNSYSVRIRTTDQGGLHYEEAYTIDVTNVNETPTDLAISANTIAENQPIGAVVGNLSTTDPDAGNTFTYTLVGGTGSTHNSFFSILNNTLKLAKKMDYETRPVLTIRLRTTDQDGLYSEKKLTIFVSDVNESPSDITLSSNNIAGNLAIGTTIGTLTTTDPDVGDTFTYTLENSGTYPDNNSFSLTGNTLESAEVFDYNTNNTYTICIRSTDAGNLNFEKIFVINITRPAYQRPDLQIKGPNDANFLGVEIYDNDLLQTSKATVATTATYNLLLTNYTTGADTFILNGPSSETGWTIRYFDARISGGEITNQITSADGWSVNVTEPTSIPIRIEVTGDNNVVGINPISVPVTVLSTNNVDAFDMVVAETTRFLPAVSLATSPNTVSVLGKPVTLTATAIGGVNFQYKFMIDATVLRNFSSSNTYTFTPALVKTYNFTVVVRDLGGINPDATVTSAIVHLDNKAALSAVTFSTTPSASSVIEGSTVTFTAAATGGASVQYKFMDGVTILRDFSASNTYSWLVPAEVGSHTISVVARDVNGINPDATVTYNKAFAVKLALSSVAMTTTPLNAALFGTPVTLTATATGGVNVQYKFMVGTSVLRDFASSNTYTFTPALKKLYTLTIVARDLGGVNPNATVTSDVNIDIRAALTAVSLATSPVNTSVAGTPVTLTGTATGGVSVQYQFKNGANILRDFDSSNSFIWTPDTANTYALTVVAKDVNGSNPNTTFTSATKNYVVTAP